MLQLGFWWQRRVLTDRILQLLSTAAQWIYSVRFLSDELFAEIVADIRFVENPCALYW